MTAPARPQLTARQLAIVQLAADGETDLRIAARLGISVHTVHDHWRHNIRPALGAIDRTHAVALAVAAGLATPTPRPEAAA